MPMILSETQLQDIILKNPNKKIVESHQDYARKMRMHMYGKEMNKELQQIDSLEKPSLQKLRVKYARSNKALFAALGRPMEKVFSAKGGQSYTNLPDAQDAAIIALSGKIDGDKSVKEWLKSYWLPHYKDDPGGLILMERPRELFPDMPQAYPTYKSSTSIFDYKIKGSSLEYLVLTMEKADVEEQGLEFKGEKFYRVIDAVFDKIVKIEGGKVVEVDTILNYFGRVPAILNSDIIDPNNENLRLSPFDEVLELAHEFMIKGSIKQTYDLQLGYPMFWRYEDDCANCGGTGYKDSEECKTCKGTGKRAERNISDVTILRAPLDKETPIIAPDVAGFVSPPKDYHEIVVSDLNSLRAFMEYTMWGRKEMPRLESGAQTDGEKTATEVVTDQQPMIDRLSEISEAAERREKFIVDHLIMAQFDRMGDSSVGYGRMYGIESIDALWDKYSKARKDGAPVFVLDAMLTEYLYMRYGSDTMGLKIVGKLKQLEPFLFKTFDQVKAMGVSEQDLKAKMYYDEWYATMTDNDIKMKTVAELRTLLYAYSDAKELPEPEPVQI